MVDPYTHSANYNRARRSIRNEISLQSQMKIEIDPMGFNCRVQLIRIEWYGSMKKARHRKLFINDENVSIHKYWWLSYRQNRMCNERWACDSICARIEYIIRDAKCPFTYANSLFIILFPSTSSCRLSTKRHIACLVTATGEFTKEENWRKHRHHTWISVWRSRKNIYILRTILRCCATVRFTFLAFPLFAAARWMSSRVLIAILNK